MTPTTILPTRYLRDLSVSALGLGCMGMAQSYGAADDRENRRTLDRALELGVTFYDTADAYGNGSNEELLGGWLQGKRERVILATKFGIVRRTEPGLHVNGRPEYVRQAVEASLKRLNTEYIDLYYLHRVDPQTPIEDTVGAMAQLVQEGKVRALGLSEAGSDTLRRASAIHPISAVQSEYSLWTRDPEDGVLATCRELGIGFVPYSPLGRGFLSGTVTSPDDLEPGDMRRNHPRFQGENFQKNLDVVTEIRRIAAEKGVTPSQLALAWVLAQGQDIVPIPGTKRVGYLEENLGALDVILTPDDLARIDAAFPPGLAQGTRQPASGMGLLNG
ncbi:aldo/keto reductase [Deinococcus sp. KSM4-11]|uniref:aldo/keto reductase n=1 Tax=Deinococcus sp. KSM4-11 TaxID=2568654 RepID=UPI0010A44C7A|nr:aldo/keto reductase [Deinococcus sp. KSM4-11]THF87383.1 aldo/keto reductase [Deinococcus sp. KSM4-11]